MSAGYIFLVFYCITKHFSLYKLCLYRSKNCVTYSVCNILNIKITGLIFNFTIHVIQLKTVTSNCDQICQNWPSSHQVTRHTFLLLINCYTNELMIHVCIIANDSLVCISWGCFLRSV